MTLIGYARVSTNQQELDIQIERLLAAGVRNSPDFLFSDKASGKSDDRDGLQRMLMKVREGDVIVSTKLDRLGRNTSDMIQIIEGLHHRGVAIRFLDDGINTEGAMGRMVVTILAAVAQAERERILERTNEGRRAAMSRGIKMGRRPLMTDSKKALVIQLISEGLPKAEIAKKLKVSRQTIYNVAGGCV